MHAFSDASVGVPICENDKENSSITSGFKSKSVVITKAVLHCHIVFHFLDVQWYSYLSIFYKLPISYTHEFVFTSVLQEFLKLKFLEHERKLRIPKNGLLYRCVLCNTSAMQIVIIIHSWNVHFSSPSTAAYQVQQMYVYSVCLGVIYLKWSLWKFLYGFVVKIFVWHLKKYCFLCASPY